MKVHRIVERIEFFVDIGKHKIREKIKKRFKNVCNEHVFTLIELYILFTAYVNGNFPALYFFYINAQRAALKGGPKEGVLRGDELCPRGVEGAPLGLKVYQELRVPAL